MGYVDAPAWLTAQSSDLSLLAARLEGGERVVCAGVVEPSSGAACSASEHARWAHPTVRNIDAYRRCSFGAGDSVVAQRSDACSR